MKELFSVIYNVAFGLANKARIMAFNFMIAPSISMLLTQGFWVVGSMIQGILLEQEGN